MRLECAGAGEKPVQSGVAGNEKVALRVDGNCVRKQRHLCHERARAVRSELDDVIGIARKGEALQGGTTIRTVHGQRHIGRAVAADREAVADRQVNAALPVSAVVGIGERRIEDDRAVVRRDLDQVRRVPGVPTPEIIAEIIRRRENLPSLFSRLISYIDAAVRAHCDAAAK
jgi:hypothetical protein